MCSVKAVKRGKGVRTENSAAYFRIDPVAEQLSTLLEPLLFNCHRLAKRLRIENKAEVLVQEWCEGIQVLFRKCIEELANELHLRRISGL
jgi:hypothetical protein